MAQPKDKLEVLRKACGRQAVHSATLTASMAAVSLVAASDSGYLALRQSLLLQKQPLWHQGWRSLVLLVLRLMLARAGEGGGE